MNPKGFSSITSKVSPELEKLKKLNALALRWQASLLFEEKRYDEALEDVRKACEVNDEETYKLKQMVETMIEMKNKKAHEKISETVKEVEE